MGFLYKPLHALFFLFFSVAASAQYLTVPPTAPINTPVNLSNVSGITDFSNNYIYTNADNFSISNNPLVNLSTYAFAGNLLQTPAFSDLAFDGTNYYLFTNNYNGGVIRWDFGPNIMSTPTAINLGVLGNVQNEGIVIRKENNNWYGFVCSNGATTKLTRINFGPNLSNTSPTTTSLGTLTLSWPHEMTIIDDGGNWYGFVANRNSRVTRLDFGNSLTNTPTPFVYNNTNIVNPCNLRVVKDNNNWYLFSMNLFNGDIVRTDIGPSLANNSPVYTNLGEPHPNLGIARGFTILQDCNGLRGIVCDEASNIFNLSFAGDSITGSLSGTPLTSITLPSGSNINDFTPFWYNDTLNFFVTNPYSWVGRCQINPTLGPNSQSSTAFSPTFTFPNVGNFDVSCLINTGSSGMRYQCDQIMTESGTIINSYAAVQAYDSCTNQLEVDDASGFQIGDTILMIQMKGAIVDSSNTSAFGNVINYNNAGNYEENIILNISGNVITLQNTVLRTYSIPDGKVQIVTVPQFTNYTISAEHTAAPWDGSKGGVFAINVTGALTLNADINVTGKGFRGAIPNSSSLFTCNQMDYFYPAAGNNGGTKGEGISIVSAAKEYGRGALANGAGGGNSTNSGGAGGGNAGMGGAGGKQYTSCDTNLILGGVGGISLTNSSALNRAFLGGGGGAGHQNDNQTTPGGNGGGLIYIKANAMNNVSGAILANGESAQSCVVSGSNLCNDGASGGGAGGTILCQIGSTNSIALSAQGGDGADYTATSFSQHGPGGGGGGGYIEFAQASIPTNVSTNLSGGINGLVLYNSLNVPFGAQPGQSGQSLTGLNMPFANLAFTPLSIQASTDTTICNGQSAQLSATGALSYSWSPSTGLSNANIANPVATPAATTQYIVTGTDVNGCTDLDTVLVTVSPGPTINVVASRDSICAGENVTLTASGANTYIWTGGVSNGVPFSPPATNTYMVTGTDVNGCNGTASYTITVLPIPNLSVVPSQPVICAGDTVFFNASGANTYLWSPSTFLTNPFIPNPYSIANTSTTYTVTGTNGAGCDTQVVVSVTVYPAANIIGVASPNPVCEGESVTLTGFGGTTYNWTGGITNGVSFVPSATGSYTVTGTDANGCSGTSNVNVTVNPIPVIVVQPDTPVVCRGDSIMLTASGGSSYLWSPSGTLSSPIGDTVMASPSVSTNYLVVSTDANNCRGTTTVNLEVIEDINLQLSKSDDIYCNPQVIQLAATGGYGYTWAPAQYLSNPNISNPRADIPRTTTFYVSSQLGNCYGRDSITVFYYDNTESGLILPNAFSPNGDGLHDCYRVISQGNYDTYEFRIFNRWGQVVFESTNANDCWDGNVGIEPVPIGTYYYFLRASGECGTVRKQGDINVIR